MPTKNQEAKNTFYAVEFEAVSPEKIIFLEPLNLFPEKWC